MKSLVIIGLSILAVPFCRAQQGPGIGNISWDVSEVFTRVGSLTSQDSTNYGNGTLHNGYWVVGIDVADGNAGLQAWDLSDPRSPVLVGERYDDETKKLREVHSFSFVKGYGRDLFSTDSHIGLGIWDWTDIENPVPYVDLAVVPGGSTTYEGINYTFWQPPYIYLGGTETGLYIVDAADPQNPEVVNQIPRPNALGGDLVSGLYAIGNLLVVTGINSKSLATYDISDPVNPVLIDIYSYVAPDGEYYSALVNGTRAYALSIDGFIVVMDFSDPGNIVEVDRSPGQVGRGGYAMYQDGYLHAGMSDNYVKFDVRGLPVVESSKSYGLNDHDWTCVMGNLVYIGDDDSSRAGIVPHSAEPDNTPPQVELIVPADGAQQQALTTRVGISFSDAIDLSSVDSTTFTVRPQGGQPLPGKYAGQMGIINFGPDESLLPNTTYEVVLSPSGVRDWAGNTLGREFKAVFYTGDASTAIIQPAISHVLQKTRVEVGSSVTVYKNGSLLDPRDINGRSVNKK